MESDKLTSLASGDKLFAFIRFSLELKGLPKQISPMLKALIGQGFVLVFIDEFLLSNFKEQMLQLIEQPHLISTKHNFKLAPDYHF